MLMRVVTAVMMVKGGEAGLGGEGVVGGDGGGFWWQGVECL
jgi:hypothetical protein